MDKQQEHPDSSGRYNLLELIGEGVSGKLYKAQDTEQNRTVLVKLVSRAVSRDPQFRRYLYDRWAESSALFEHPNIAQVIEVSKRGEQYYAVVEELPARRLSETMKDAPLDPDEVIEIVRQIAEALRAAHRREIIHGNLKPSDVFLTEDTTGQPLIKVLFLDLGVTAAESILSLFGEVCGPPQYMAPEVIKGNAPGPQSDIFAVGVIAYQLLTSSDPFPAQHPVGYLFANCQGRLTPPDQVQPSIPAELSRVVCRCLEQDPEHRYQSAQRLIDDLDRCVEIIKTGRVSMVPMGSDSAFARQYEIARPDEPGARRLRWLPGLGWAALALVLLVLAGFWLHDKLAAPSPTSSPKGAEPPPLALLPQSDQPPGASDPTSGVVERGTALAREQEALAAFNRAKSDWDNRYKLRGEYDAAEAAFKNVAAQHPDTAHAATALEMAAQINCDWAAALMRSKEQYKRQFEKAEARCREAIALAPAGSQWRQLALRRLPEVLQDWADYCDKRGLYEKALALYEGLEQEFPGTLQASLRKQREPDIYFKQAFYLWKDQGKMGEALDKFLYVMQTYPGTRAAQQCQENVPPLYLDMAKAKIESGKLQEARKDLARVSEAFPGTGAAKEAAALEAQVLYDLFEQARKTGRPEEASALFEMLAAEHPTSSHTQQAARIHHDLMPEPGEQMFDALTARRRYERAKRLGEEMDYAGAEAALRLLVRSTRADSEIGRKALQELPEVIYQHALQAYGKQKPERCRKALEGLARDFAYSQWGAKAAQTLSRMENTPPGMVFVPEGSFEMGASLEEIVSFLKLFYADTPEVLQREGQRSVLLDVLGFSTEIPRHVASTGAFYVDKTEITNAQYKEFVDAVGHAPPPYWQDGTFPKAQARRPVTDVSHDDAAAYANWGGKRLPTEAEWEKAARGVDGRLFSWGNVFREDHCHHLSSSEVGPVDVGSFPSGASPYGCLDMIGNVLEWTQSRSTPYPGGETTGPETSHEPSQRVLRGGAWMQHDLVKPIPIRCSCRFLVKPEATQFYRPGDTGFRCVKDLE